MANGQSQQQPQQPAAPTLDDYRESLVDALSFVEGLVNHCQSLPELIEMMRLGTKNDSQLKLLIKLAGPVHFRG